MWKTYDSIKNYLCTFYARKIKIHKKAWLFFGGRTDLKKNQTNLNKASVHKDVSIHKITVKK